MIYFINILIIFGLLYLGYKSTRRSKLARYYWPAIILKMLSGILVGIVYTHYYAGGDTFSFFDAAIQIKAAAFSSWKSFIDIYFRNIYTAIPEFNYTWIPSALFSKLLAVLALISGSNYWISGIYLSLFSLLGFWKFGEALTEITENRLVAIITVFFFPSILFWTSGIMKESIAIGALAWLLALFIELYLNRKISVNKVITGVLLLALVALLKYYLAALFIASSLTALAVRKILSKESSWYKELLISVAVFATIGGIVSLLHPNLWPSRIAEVIYSNYQAYESLSKPENLISFQSLGPNVTSVLISSPKALFTGIYYPLWTTEFFSLKAFGVIENWILLVLSTYAIIKFKLSSSRETRILVWAALLFIILSAVLITLSTPNVGTLSRYKTGHLIVLLPLILPSTLSRIKVILAKA